MNYRPQPIIIDFKTVTPVFIGSGEEIKPLSFISQGRNVYIVDESAFFQRISEEARALYLNWIDPIVEQMGRLDEQIAQTNRADRRTIGNLRRQSRQIESRLSLGTFIQERLQGVDPVKFIKAADCIAYQTKTTTSLSHNGFRACLKDIQHNPYLPGTEIKGALRTAFLFALLEDVANYQILKQEVQQFGDWLRRERPHRNQVKRKMPQIIDAVESQLLRGLKNDAKFDLLRMLRVSDSGPVSISKLRLEKSKSVGTDRFTDTILETIGVEAQQKFRLEVVEGEEEFLNHLGFTGVNQRVSIVGLMEACYKRSSAILQVEKAFFEQNRHWALTQRIDELLDLNSPQTPLLRLGGGQGFLSITIDIWLRERDPGLYEAIRQGVSHQRNWRSTVNGNFPKTRRVVWRTEEPKELLGWIQLLPPVEIRELVKADLRFEISHVSEPVPSQPTSTVSSEAASERQMGRVKWFNSTKGYGFIKPDSGNRDAFVHISEVDGPPLSDGERVSFKLNQSPKGLEAKNVKREA